MAPKKKQQQGLSEHLVTQALGVVLSHLPSGINPKARATLANTSRGLRDYLATQVRPAACLVICTSVSNHIECC